MTYTRTRFDGYNLYFTSHCGRSKPPEPVHAHVSRHSMEVGAAKLWIYTDGTTSVKERGGVPEKTLASVRRWIAENYIDMFRQWNTTFSGGFVMTLEGGHKAIEVILSEVAPSV